MNLKVTGVIDITYSLRSFCAKYAHVIPWVFSKGFVLFL